MMDSSEPTSTRPYLIRALYEWCTDNGFTPYIAVSVNEQVQVPREYVKDGEIVLNISFEATTALKLGNDFIEFKARFAGTAREIMVPIGQVMAIYARENGQGMAFPLLGSEAGKPAPAASPTHPVSAPDGDPASASRAFQLTSVESERGGAGADDEPEPPRPAATGPRPALKRVK